MAEKSNMKTLLCISTILAALSVSYTKELCPKLKPAVGLQMTEILGTWYAMRGIEHTAQEFNNSAQGTKACPTIEITSEKNVIEFQWHSKNKPLKKLELVPNKDYPGLLEHATKKGDSKSSLQLIILENTKNVIGATMCKAGGRIASVILNRNPTFNREEAQSITNMLASQGLNISSIFDRCS